MIVRVAAAALAIFVALGADPSLAGDKAIDGVRAGTFRFGAMAIGQAKDADYARAEGLGLIPASPLDKYLNGVLAKLLEQSPVQGVPARAYVRASGDWAAKSTADANIYVALGTLLRLDDEDEVAAVLAHEASHVILGHADADVVQEFQQRALQVSSLALDTRDLIHNDQSGSAGASKSSGAGTKEQSRALLLNTMLIAPAWTREQERDADRLGADLLARAGYSPKAMIALLRKQASFETERAADPEAQSLEQSLAAFGVDVNAAANAGTAKVTEGTGAAGQDLGALAGATLGKAFSWGSKKLDDAKRSHPKTEERIAEMEAYVAREHADTAQKPTRAEPWDAAKEQDGTVDVLENYIAAIEAKGELADGNVAAAGRLAKSSLTGTTRTHAYPNYVDAAVQIAQGASPAALADYERALGGPEPAGAIYSETSALYLQTGKPDKAREVIERGYKRLSEPPSLTLPLIRTYRMMGLEADAARVAAQCAARWPKMQELCSKEAKGA